MLWKHHVASSTEGKFVGILVQRGVLHSSDVLFAKRDSLTGSEEAQGRHFAQLKRDGGNRNMCAKFKL